LRHGSIVVQEGGSRETFGAPSDEFPVAATLTIHDPAFYTEAVLGGQIGAGEAYMDGLWSSDDLTSLVRIMARNDDLADGIEGGAARFKGLLQKVANWQRRNTRTGSRRNIAGHYDLGNDLFKTFLDPTMMYSCAIYPGEGSSLDEAAVHKLDVVCRKLELSPQDELLEIGTGWGGLAIHAAKNYGCRVTTTTISKEQHDLAVERIAAAGLSDRITVLMEDYRDLPDRLGKRFDKLVSIEMIEAVGERFLEQYFATCSRMLKADGLMVLQGITIADRYYDSYRKSVDFIQRYIFPGGFLPSIGAMTTAAAQATDLTVTHLQELGPHYARTLKDWRDNFNARLDRIRELGYDERFIRMWEFYLCYCEGGFLERTVGAVQIVLNKPHNRRDPIPSGA
jgi:cyclopropane-fatty-acyl-phospholipid synthase